MLPGREYCKEQRIVQYMRKCFKRIPQVSAATRRPIRAETFELLSLYCIQLRLRVYSGVWGFSQK